MVDKIMLIAALCITGAILCRVTEKYNKEQAVMLAAIICIIITGYVLLHISPALVLINDMCSSCGIEERFSVIIFKSLGICYITQFACDICHDCGENALASAAEISGKTSLLILSIPLLEELSDFIGKLTI